MANYMSDAALNLAANEVTNRTISVRIHSGAPGNNGTGNRIGAFSVNHPAADWTAASGGECETNKATSFGVLNSGAATTVRAYSCWAGSTFLGWADLSAAVTVPAGGAFQINSGGVSFDFNRP